mmetsp:Transcript_1577/g.2768  ORF Transcript_1577/g.2768 Transcript_1577/m.2768 type:complete len:202 (+) Transcript_1577:1109-1714(+)
MLRGEFLPASSDLRFHLFQGFRGAINVNDGLFQNAGILLPPRSAGRFRWIDVTQLHGDNLDLLLVCVPQLIVGFKSHASVFPVVIKAECYHHFGFVQPILCDLNNVFARFRLTKKGGNVILFKQTLHLVHVPEFTFGVETSRKIEMSAMFRGSVLHNWRCQNAFRRSFVELWQHGLNVLKLKLLKLNLGRAHGGHRSFLRH